MNKNIIIAAVVGLILLLAGGGYLLSKNSKKTPTDTTVQTQTTEKKSASQRASIKSLMGMNATQQCSFTSAENGTSGTIYLSGGKMAGTFSSTVNGTVVASHMISDTQYTYVWMGNEKTGFKMAISAAEKAQASAKQSVDLNEELDYSCSGWGVDASKFTVPTDVKFTDYTSMMEDASKLLPKTSTGTGEQDNSAACSACNSLPEASQVQCKSALKCN